MNDLEITIQRNIGEGKEISVTVKIPEGEVADRYEADGAIATNVYVLMKQICDRLTDQEEESLPKPRYQEPSKFPAVRQDMSFVVGINVLYDLLERAIIEVGEKEGIIIRTQVADIYQWDEETESKKITYSLTFQSMDRTLTKDEVKSLKEKIVMNTARQCGAKLI